MLSRLWLVPFLLAVAVAGAWWFGFRNADKSPELPVYLRGAERMAAGEEIYRRGTDDKRRRAHSQSKTAEMGWPACGTSER